jgi:DNA adenine methylase
MNRCFQESLRSVALPFLKWPGGKRWLVSNLLREIGSFQSENYFEPFLGGGALFFALQPKFSVLSDINPELINAYEQVKKNPEQLVRRLRALPVNPKTYEAFRRKKKDSPFYRAIRFLYLNRTAFAGMYRLNRKGEFNVPYGGGERTPAILWQKGLIKTASILLRRSRLEACDFETAISVAGLGDLVYCDPTYTVMHNNNGFVRYNEKNFSWEDQKRLAACCKRAAQRGVFVLVSNAHHAEILQLFSPPCHTIVVRTSLLCPNSAYRRETAEYLFLYRPARRRIVDLASRHEK